ncbi:MAG: tetratricopeptide repeat protein [Rikenellaceae bacterium]|nr:tetratricopeptide repeat protein [Rikenellaceae bacterium]MBQ5679732.1 tetratricopeptide repeat protein [Rikenellaceae bacterium]
MGKKIDQVEYSCTPEILSLNNGEVTANITVKFPPKYFNEGAVLKITPVLVFEGGEIAGTPKYVQGENVNDNYTVISWAKGGQYTQTVTFPYDERAKISTLELRTESKCSSKCSENYSNFVAVDLATVTVAKGINTLQSDLNYADAMQYMADNFKKSETVDSKLYILYNINQAKVGKKALNDEQTKLFKEFVLANKDKENSQAGNIFVEGYASPDGPEKLNNDLSVKRGKAGRAAVEKKLADIEGLTYNDEGFGEDWEGFQELVAASDMEDKDLILQVLKLYDSPVTREAEIKNMSEVYSALKEDVLPALRRAKVVSTAELASKTDDELKACVASNLKDLDCEEMMYAATLYEDPAMKAKIYEACAKKFNDARAYNNLGVALSEMGDYKEAADAFKKAAKLAASSEVNNNIAMVNAAEGNLKEAKKYAATASKEAQALVAAAEGNYTDAANKLTGYNAAIAEYQNGNLAAAKKALQGDNSANAEYLRAVIAAKEGKVSEAAAYLKNAIAKNKDLAEKAKNDVNLANVAK